MPIWLIVLFSIMVGVGLLGLLILIVSIHDGLNWRKWIKRDTDDK